MSAKGYPHWKLEMATTPFRQAVVAEFLATFMFIFSTIGCVVFTQDGGITTARQMEVSLIFGNAITILVFIFAGISGANINPAVSFALFVSKKMSWIRCLCYTIAQCLGAMTGAGMVRIMTPAMFDKVDGGANEISASANSREALGVEFGCTFMLVMTVMAATDTHRAEKHQHLPTIAPIVIGMAVTAAHFIAIPVDNCSINPARSFGVSVISGNFNDAWVFWFGPYLGSVAAALCYNYLFLHEDAIKEAEERAAAEAAAAAALAGASAVAPAYAATPLPPYTATKTAETVEATAAAGAGVPATPAQEWR